MGRMGAARDRRMLETKFKIALLLAVLFLTSLPVMGILKGTSPPPREPSLPEAPEDASPPADTPPIPEEMTTIPAGAYIRGTSKGGYDERPERSVYLDAFAVDRFEVTNHHYGTFIAATGHRKAGPPSRYAKNMSRMRGANQPVVYVSWDDADAYCRWKGKRLPTEAEWEKAMRGVDGRMWPWGNEPRPSAANWGVANDGFEVAAPVDAFALDASPFGVRNGAGNVMEWVADWYGEEAYRDPVERNPTGPPYGVYRVLRGGGYTTTGDDMRITSRSKMVPDFRDETIGFRCAVSLKEDGNGGTEQKGNGQRKSK